MPQVDLETLVSACAGGSMDRKIACETQASAAAGIQDHPEDDDDAADEPAVPPDFPPESFWLSKDAEFDWFDRNAFFERKDSTKGNSTSNNPNLNSNSNSNSQRFSLNLKSKAAIIGLPKPQKPNYADAKNRRICKAGNGRLFPKRSGSIGKSDAPMIEPSSPKVSCMGRVRSKRDRKRRFRNRPRPAETPIEKPVKPVERQKSGFFASFRAIFRHGRDKSAKSPYVAADTPPKNSSVMTSARGRDRAAAYDIDTLSVDSFPRHSVESEPPSLGGMKRFVSGRRSTSLVGESGIDVA